MMMMKKTGRNRKKNYINIIVCTLVGCLALSLSSIVLRIFYMACIYPQKFIYGHLSHTEIACKIMFIFFLLHHRSRRQRPSLWFDIVSVWEYECGYWPDNNKWTEFPSTPDISFRSGSQFLLHLPVMCIFGTKSDSILVRFMISGIRCDGMNLSP